ncbi:MAG TPA: hypothetical protein VF791_19870 [Pyrinomonadaceae bacterium]
MKSATLIPGDHLGRYEIKSHLGAGGMGEAFRWLEKAYEDRSSRLVHAKAEQYFDPLRSDPRFKDLLRRVGLPQ